jgi:hypothetical protein
VGLMGARVAGRAAGLGAAHVEEEGRVRLLLQQLVPLLRHGPAVMSPRDTFPLATRPRHARKGCQSRCAADRLGRDSAAVDAVGSTQVVRDRVEDGGGVAAPFERHHAVDPILPHQRASFSSAYLQGKTSAHSRLTTSFPVRRSLMNPSYRSAPVVSAV